MDRELTEKLAIAREHAWSIPIEAVNVADPELFRHDTIWPYFERLRKEAPVHYQPEHEFGPYWSVTKYNDIMTVDTNHEVFSSEPAITIAEPKDDFRLPMFIAMDPPKHDEQRKVVSPIVAGPISRSWSRSSASGRNDPRQPAGRRDVRLGGQGVHRTHHHDAGHPVRFPMGRSPQAHPLVGRRDREPEKRVVQVCRNGGRRETARSCSNAPTISCACGTSG